MWVRWILPLAFFLFATLFASSCSQSPQAAQGYIEGRYTYIATPVSGVLKQLLVNRGDNVAEGQQLFLLEAQPESDSFAAAEQNLKQSVAARDATIANLAYAKITYQRYKILVPKNAIQQSLLDSAKSTYDATIAQLAQANATIAASTATLAEAQWTLNQKILYAPLKSQVFDIYFRLGEYTIANQAILSLLAPADIKVVFYVGEENLAAIHLHHVVTVRCDHCQQHYSATISFISPSAEYTPPVIYSEKTSEKLVYRIEAVFTAHDAMLLHPGQPVLVNYTNHD